MIKNTVTAVDLTKEGHSYGVSFDVATAEIAFSVDFITHGYTLSDSELRQYFKQPLAPLYKEASEFHQNYPEIDFSTIHNLIQEILTYTEIGE